MSRQRILSEISEERTRQDVEHGGSSHDDTLLEADWIVILARHLGLACGDEGIIDDVRYRKQLIRVASVAVAAIEALDRKNEVEYVAGANPIGKGW